MIQEIVLDEQTSIRCGYDECDINDGVVPNTVLYSGVINLYHRESEEFDPICFVVISTAKTNEVKPEVMVSQSTIDEVTVFEILDELDGDLKRCGTEDNQRVDELRYEYLDRLPEIKDSRRQHNLGESIKHKISEWYAGNGNN